MTDGGANGWFARQRARIEALWAQPQVRFGTLVGGLGLAAGLVISAGTTSVIRQTNSTEFCVSCHVYENFYEEFRTSDHFRNATGVQASCASCHLPHDNWAAMIAAKAHSGFKDVWAYTLGGIDTPEDFEARRATLARDIWNQYERNDSQFCRHCHEPEAWDLEAQSAMARGAHQSVVDGDATCIACHKGVAHSIPEGARGGGDPAADAQQDGGDPDGARASASAAAEDGGEASGTAGDASAGADGGDATDAQRASDGDQSAADGDTGGDDSPAEDDGEERMGTGNGSAQTAATSQREGGGPPPGEADGTGSDENDRPDDALSAKDAAHLASNCRMCHGAAAPALESFASLDEEAFLTALESHMAAGGTVESLTTAERRALHRYLRR